VHFGWARFSVTEHGVATLTGYAYETVPYKPIVTGDTEGNNDDEDSVHQQEPSAASAQSPGLGRLALGAGLIAQRDTK
jgi:dethiobiotin synthetase